MGHSEEETKLWGSGPGLGFLLRVPGCLCLSAAPTPPSRASDPGPGSVTETTSILHSEVRIGELKLRMAGDLAHALHGTAAAEVQLPSPRTWSGGTAPAGDKGKSLDWLWWSRVLQDLACYLGPLGGKRPPGLGAGEAGAYHIPPSGDCRIPTPSEAGAFSHLDRDSHLPGRSWPCHAICLWILAPNCQPWV